MKRKLDVLAEDAHMAMSTQARSEDWRGLNAHLTVLHCVTLAVVRKLGCEGDAGLAEKPVLKALPE
ncbi:hypothetical protein [Streptomyces sp. NPDC058486]|uniref:hypothetical protein n=1 Tax=unclassified Streptomyces TaxID=2593676 RepID=UPI00365A72F8